MNWDSRNLFSACFCCNGRMQDLCTRTIQDLGLHNQYHPCSSCIDLNISPSSNWAGPFFVHSSPTFRVPAPLVNSYCTRSSSSSILRQSVCCVDILASCSEAWDSHSWCHTKRISLSSTGHVSLHIYLGWTTTRHREWVEQGRYATVGVACDSITSFFRERRSMHIWCRHGAAVKSSSSNWVRTFWSADMLFASLGLTWCLCSKD